MGQNIDEIAPKCIGFIMDGNRRWAKREGLPAFEGHRRGYSKLKEVVAWAKEYNINTVIAYALSTENWRRTKEEIGYLMDLFRYALGNEIDSLIKEKTKLIFIGNKSAFPDDIQALMTDAENKTKDYPGTILAIAASYGGREEIVEAAKGVVHKNIAMTEENIKGNLYTADLPDPDIIIRTGGQKRLSGFLAWQSIYSELFFINTMWPEFDRKEFKSILTEYTTINKNLGK